jgi:ribosomal protein S4
MYYNFNFFFKNYLFFNFFYEKFVFKKLKKKLNIKKLFKDFFWNIESRLDIFLIRNGFVKNYHQSNYVLFNRGVYINGKVKIINY